MFVVPHWALSYLPEEAVANLVPGLDLSFDTMLAKDTARELVARYREDHDDFLREALQPVIQAMAADQGESHSDGVVAVDRWGNMAAVTHSINTVLWGRTGIIVDGVSIPDSAAIQLEAVKERGVEVQLIPPTYRGNSNGGSFVVGIESNEAGGEYRGSTTTKTGGMALAVVD